MNAARPSESGRLRFALRALVLFALAAAPVAIGSVHAPAYIPLLSVCFLVGALSWARAHWARAQGHEVPRVPVAWVLAAMLGLVHFQLLPLPAPLLGLLSPGSRSYWEFVTLGPLSAWRPITLSPPDTLRGAFFLAGFALLYAASYRDFHDPRWKRRLMWTIAGTAFFVTLVALVQAASGQRKILGLFQPKWDYFVFGTYVNRNHFAGYVAPAIFLAVGLAAEGYAGLRDAMTRRRRGWLALVDRPGMAYLRRAALLAVLVVGLLTSGSRGGLMAFAVGAAAWPVLRPRRGTLALGLVGAVVGALILLPRIQSGSGTSASDPTHRMELWQDVIRMFPHFPVFGAGFNAFGTSYYRYKSIWPGIWFGEAHNEYLQSLIDMGAIGAGLVLVLLGTLVACAFRSARAGPLETGIACAVIASCAHNVVEFNWQVPANAVTMAAVAGLAVRVPGSSGRRRRRSSGPTLDHPEEAPLESATR